MGTINNMINELDELTIAALVERVHNHVREAYRLHLPPVLSTVQVENEWGRYFAYHHEASVSKGGKMSPAEATGRAKQLIENAYRRRRQTMINALADAKEHKNGGLPAQLTVIAEGLREECVDNYVEDVISRYCDQDNHAQRAALMSEFMARFGEFLPDHLRNLAPERLASNYKELISAFLEGRKHVAEKFRGT